MPRPTRSYTNVLAHSYPRSRFSRFRVQLTQTRSSSDYEVRWRTRQLRSSYASLALMNPYAFTTSYPCPKALDLVFRIQTASMIANGMFRVQIFLVHPKQLFPSSVHIRPYALDNETGEVDPNFLCYQNPELLCA